MITQETSKVLSFVLRSESSTTDCLFTAISDFFFVCVTHPKPTRTLRTSSSISCGTYSCANDTLIWALNAQT